MNTKVKQLDKVVALKCIPTKLPVTSTAVIYLLMDKFDASPLDWGIVGTLWGMSIICAIISMFSETRIDIFKTGSGI